LPLSEVDLAAFPRAYTATLDGHAPADIRETLAKEFPAANAERIFNHIQRAFERAADRGLKAVHGWCIESSRDLYRKMTEVGDYEGALRAVKQVAALAETIADRQEDPTATAGQLIDLFPAEAKG